MTPERLEVEMHQLRAERDAARVQLRNVLFAFKRLGENHGGMNSDKTYRRYEALVEHVDAICGQVGPPLCPMCAAVPAGHSCPFCYQRRAASPSAVESDGIEARVGAWARLVVPLTASLRDEHGHFAGCSGGLGCEATRCREIL